MKAENLLKIESFHNHEELRVTAAKAITHMEMWTGQGANLASFFLSAALAADAANAA